MTLRTARTFTFAPTMRISGLIGWICRFDPDFRKRLLRGFAEHFGVDGDPDFVAHDQTAVVHGGVPLHVKVLAIDRGSGVDGHTLIAPGIFDGSGRTIYIQSDFFGDAVNGQLAGDFQLVRSDLLDFTGLECDRGIMGDVEEMVAQEIFVAGGDAGIDGAYVDDHVDGRFRDVVVVELD